ncbi:MAG: flagellar biosynthetic protein FliO [Betaproteobacteria bacterium]|nr:flagellar biosynthetic protein FliO [Betaproteobacteria bacterium]
MKRLAAGVVLALPVLAHAAVTPAAPAPAVSAAGSLFQVFVGLVAVLLLIAATAWVAKRFGVTRPGAPGVLQVIGSASVGARERVVVVEVGESWLVMGVAPGRVNALATLPRGEAPPPSAPALNASFAAGLQALLEKSRLGDKRRGK